jgi:hypothetical protein
MGPSSGNSSTTPGGRTQGGMAIDHNGQVWCGWGNVGDSVSFTVADLWYVSRSYLHCCHFNEIMLYLAAI